LYFRCDERPIADDDEFEPDEPASDDESGADNRSVAASDARAQSRNESTSAASDEDITDYDEPVSASDDESRIQGLVSATSSGPYHEVSESYETELPE